MARSIPLPSYRVPVSADVLRWARDTAGLSIEDVERLAQVSAARVQAWEEASDAYPPPTVAQLRSLSNMYKRPISLFLLEVAPAEQLAATYARRLHGADPEVGTHHLRFAIRDACDERRIALDLLSAMRESPPALAAAPVEGLRPEPAAEVIRKGLGVSDGDVIAWGRTGATLQGWIDTLDAAGVLVVQFRYVDVEERRGFAVLEFPLPVIALNESDARAARLFTLLHEFAHIQRALNNMDANDEYWCNAVAAALLMPEHLARRQIETSGTQDWRELGLELANAFAVSREAAYRRLATLGVIGEAQYEAVREEIGQEPKGAGGGGFARYPTGEIRRLGRQYIRIVGEAYERGEISLHTASRYLGVQGRYVDPLVAAADRGGTE
jgi:Zn-dependent peptidase ImmA (M78 family)/transcriptional regulator with XRE-family HTH domain